MAFKNLPTFYYHTHFLEFLSFVRGPNAHLLNEEHQFFLNTFDALSQLEQCTLVRLINRKYKVIKRASLVFSEIPNIDENLASLTHKKLATQVSMEDLNDFLQVLTKAELITLYEECADIESACLKKSAAKALIQAQCALLDASKMLSSSVANGYIVRASDHHLAYFLYLYFGHNHGKLAQFSMRDLGIMRTQDEQAQMQSRFTDYPSAFSCFNLHSRLHEIKRTVFDTEQQINTIITTLPEVCGTQAQVYFDKIMYLLAKATLAFNPEKSLELAAPIEGELAQEFWCRQAYKLGHKDAVETRLNKLIDEPLSEHLLQFAEDFLARKYKQKRTSILTDMLRENNRHLQIDETYKGSVESGVIAYYQARKIQAWRTENTLWSNLFGLVFWHELFEIEGMGLATPFDYLPLCIKHHQLMTVCGDAIQARLAALDSCEAMLLLITKNAATHYGKGQSIVRWHAAILEKLQILITHASLSAIKQQLLLMCSNYQLYNDGYPDIMVLENDSLRFEEIKAPGDSLRRNQLLQIQALKQHGFEVGITTVEYTLDPMQPYAIVDIETTGGRSDTHKITEIGIVKMINGEVVDQWQSLINPQRRIPSMITRLTGISDDMVADAPLFADIADELAQFTENCVFVAHNVNFDYGFIREEYARINRSYKRPKICTVQEMRKHYKGLPSYSLANLTRHFDISMQRHHRALSDAVAATELLKLVNEVRMQTQ